jgi:hypothetical protein
MKVGDMVKKSGDLSQAWRIIDIRTNARGYWVRINEAQAADDVWYIASYFEVINENR